jgi:hypothetical protein
LLIKFQSLGREIVHALIVESLGMPPRHPHQAGDGLCGYFHEPGCGPDTTTFTQMVDDILHGGLWELGIDKAVPRSLGELLPASATAQQADTVMPIHLPDNEVVSTGVTQQLAFGIDTG